MGWKNLATRLQKRFGLGVMPLVSRRLYARLEREAEKHGEAVMLIISECVESSSCAGKDKGAWFRASVARRLREHGFLLNKHQEQQAEQIAELRDKVLRMASVSKEVTNG